MEDVLGSIKNGASVCLLSAREPFEVASRISRQIQEFGLSKQVVLRKPWETNEARQIAREYGGLIYIAQIKANSLTEFLAEIVMAIHSLSQCITTTIEPPKRILIVNGTSLPADVINFVLPRLTLQITDWKIYWTNFDGVFPIGTMTI
ncbi:MAG: hypothetical protein HW405_100 [Candidatus Berkelbacteria bacterium]|nr:hypothetical protein [Candidatus Berkelbacteria bacterium]